MLLNRTYKIVIFLTAALLVPFSQDCLARSLELITYYPAPLGAYDRVTLTSRVVPSTCQVGAIMVDQTTTKLLYCHDVGGTGTWGYLSKTWTMSGKNVYPTATDGQPLIFGGIGTSAPDFKLTLDNDGGILALGTYGFGVTTTYYNPTSPNKTTPPEGRFISYPRKGVFRAIWSRWNVANDAMLGNHSVGFGDTPLASGTASTVSGLWNAVPADFGTIAGGADNLVSGRWGTIAGGERQSRHWPIFYSGRG